MIDREHDLPIVKQAEVLRISRGSVYYLPRAVPDADLAIMRRLDRLHLEFPFAGSRMLQGLLVAEGSKIGRRHVKTLMRRMGIEALYRRPRTTKPEPGPRSIRICCGIQITRPNQVWAMDITYIPMERGFVYLAVVIDWFSRRVLSWRVSITLEAAFCVAAVEEAMGSTDGRRSSTRTRARSSRRRLHGLLAANGIAISMDGQGAGGTIFSWNACGAHQVRRGLFEGLRQRQRPRDSRPVSRLLQRRRPHSSLDGTRRITHTSLRCLSAWQPNPGDSTYRRGKSVQTTGTTSYQLHIRVSWRYMERM